MSTSERASASIRQMPERDQPISESFRLTAREYADADAAASLLEELKSVTLEKLKSELIAEKGDMPDNKAERMVKASRAWEEYVRNMCVQRARATKLRLKLEWTRMKFSEWQALDATARAEMRLSR